MLKKLEAWPGIEMWESSTWQQFDGTWGKDILIDSKWLFWVKRSKKGLVKVSGPKNSDFLNQSIGLTFEGTSWLGVFAKKNPVNFFFKYLVGLT